MRYATKILAAGLMAVVTAGTASAGGYFPKPLPPNGNPGPFPPRPDTDYVVSVRGLFGGWRPYSRYETLNQARRAAWRLEGLGYRVRVEPVFGGPIRW